MKKCIKYTGMPYTLILRKKCQKFYKACRQYYTLLIIIPVQEKQGKGTHHKEEQDPYSKSSIVFDGL